MIRLFLLSPAQCAGERARQVLDPRAGFDLARRLRGPAGAPLGEVFSFLSGLYFRGKLTYARAFARTPGPAAAGVWVITPGMGLLPPDTPIGVAEMQEFARVSIAEGERRFSDPLLRDARRLAAALDGAGDVVLLGSIASTRYLDLLAPVFGERLLFPKDFVGRGDMSRGGLLLRRVAEGRELEYVPASGAVRHGPRPPRLERLR